MKVFGTRTNLVVVLLTLTTMLGCSALNAKPPAAQQSQQQSQQQQEEGTAITSGQIALNPKSISFGNVAVGEHQTQSVTLTNSGIGSVTITQAVISGEEFALTGLSLPVVLKAKQTLTMGVTFTPTVGGINRGAISLIGTTRVRFASRRPTWGRGQDGQEPPTDGDETTTSTSLEVPVSGIGMLGGSLGVSPSALTLGKVRIGASQTQSATLVNSGNANVTVKQAVVSGRGFRMSGISFPLTLSPGERRTFSVTFKADSPGTASGVVAVTSDAPNSVMSIPLSAVGVGSGILVSNPASLSFTSTQAGHGGTVSAALTNSGTANLTVSQATVSGTGFTVGGLSLPLTLAPGQSTAFSVTFSGAQSGGSASGMLSLASDASNGTLTVPLVATIATNVGVLSTSPSSLDFSNVPVSGTNTLSETLTNTGSSTVNVTQANVTGTGFKITGLSLPLKLSPGQSFTFGTVFAPTSGGSANGSISVISDASNSTLTISMVGTATVAAQLAVSPAVLNFGSVTVGQSKSLSGSLTAGGSSITITSANMSTPEFSVSGLSLPVTVASGNSVSFSVKFTPQASGVASAIASFNSNASNSSVQQSLTGSATPAPQHSVALSWNASSSSTVVGYNVYRGVQTGGPYSQITSMNADTTFTDSSVQAGQTYFYVGTAVDARGKESTYSNQTQAVIPTP